MRTAIALVIALAVLVFSPATARADGEPCRWFAGGYAFVLPTEPNVDHFLVGARVGCAQGPFGFRGTVALGGLTVHTDKLGRLGMAGLGVEYVSPRGETLRLIGALDGGFQSFGRGGLIVDDPSTGADEVELFVEPSATLQIHLGLVAFDFGLGVRVRFNGSGTGAAPDLITGFRIFF